MNLRVEDITTVCKPPRRGRFTLNYIEAHEDPEDGALLMKLRGPNPKGGLGPIVVNRHNCITCIVGQERRDQAGHLYEPASELCKPAGRQPVYIRGRPGGGLRTTDNNSRLRQSVFAPWSLKPQQFHHN